jgi:hypothetical protein
MGAGEVRRNDPRESDQGMGCGTHVLGSLMQPASLTGRGS